MPLLICYVELAADRQNYVAFIPEMPGYHAGGATEEEARARLRQKILTLMMRSSM